MDVIKLAYEICGGVCEKLCSRQEMDQRVMQQKFYDPLRAIKLVFHG